MNFVHHNKMCVKFLTFLQALLSYLHGDQCLLWHPSGTNAFYVWRAEVPIFQGSSFNFGVGLADTMVIQFAECIFSLLYRYNVLFLQTILLSCTNYLICLIKGRKNDMHLPCLQNTTVLDFIYLWHYIVGTRHSMNFVLFYEFFFWHL